MYVSCLAGVMEIKNAQKLKISGTTQGGFQHLK